MKGDYIHAPKWACMSALTHHGNILQNAIATLRRKYDLLGMGLPPQRDLTTEQHLNQVAEANDSTSKKAAEYALFVRCAWDQREAIEVQINNLEQALRQTGEVKLRMEKKDREAFETAVHIDDEEVAKRIGRREKHLEELVSGFKDLQQKVHTKQAMNDKWEEDIEANQRAFEETMGLRMDVATSKAQENKKMSEENKTKAQSLSQAEKSLDDERKAFEHENTVKLEALKVQEEAFEHEFRLKLEALKVREEAFESKEQNEWKENRLDQL